MRLLQTLFFVLLAAGTHAQTVWINSVQVLPASPTPGTPVKVVVKVSTSNGGRLLSSSWARTNDTLRITNCYLCNPTAVVPTYIDTIKVGLLPAGRFTVKFTAQASPYPDCSLASTVRQNQAFQVGAALATVPDGNAGWTLYPMPANDRRIHLDRPDAVALQTVVLLDLAGRECYRTNHEGDRPITGLVVSPPDELAAGTYILRLALADGRVGSWRVMLP